MVRDTLINKLDERQMNEQSDRIYTTLDPDLQKAAAQAVENGMKLVDEQVQTAAHAASASGRAESTKPRSNRARRRRSHWW